MKIVRKQMNKVHAAVERESYTLQTGNNKTNSLAFYNKILVYSVFSKNNIVLNRVGIGT